MTLKLITTKKNVKAISSFLLLASSKDDRNVLECINIQPKYIEATDRRALLRIFLGDIVSISDKIFSGPARIVGCQKLGADLVELILDPVTDAEYPNTEQVVPERSLDQVLVNLQPEVPYNVSETVIRLYRHTGNGYQTEYLERLLPLGLSWAASKAKKGRPIRLDGKAGDVTYTAVIMPFELEKEIQVAISGKTGRNRNG